jgi:hypothetical protein
MEINLSALFCSLLVTTREVDGQETGKAEMFYV